MKIEDTAEPSTDNLESSIVSGNVVKDVDIEEKPSVEESPEEQLQQDQQSHGTPQKYITEYKTTPSNTQSLNRG